MAWYWWVLIAGAVVALGALKLVVFKKLMAKKKAERPEEDEE